ncbi:unnamed protein product [Spodoptera exigua]|nr:unnamed protein product [Spodoptera exigua]
MALVVTVNKTEVQEFNDSSNSSRLTYDEGAVKIEGPEWKRDEDKLILEILKEHLSPEERQDKTILELFHEKNIVSIIAESLTDKSTDDITTRMAPSVVIYWLYEARAGRYATYGSDSGRTANYPYSPSVDPRLLWPEIISRSPTPGMSPTAAAGARGGQFPHALRLLLCEHRCLRKGLQKEETASQFLSL